MGGHFSKGLAGYNIGNVQQFFLKYLQCVLEARILIMDFVCTLAVKKKNQGRFRPVGSDHSLVRSWARILLETWMFVYVYSLFVLSCAGSGHATG
jgi:hypothetical protein